MPATGTTWRRILKIIATFLQPMFSIATPMIREALDKFLTEWYKKAQLTENPADDYLVEFIASLLGINIKD
jgi:hypothetical protein